MKQQKEKYPDKAIEILNKYFSKGNKKRGEAMCLLAITLWEGKEIGKQETKQEVLNILKLHNIKIPEVIARVKELK